MLLVLTQNNHEIAIETTYRWNLSKLLVNMRDIRGQVVMDLGDPALVNFGSDERLLENFESLSSRLQEVSLRIPNFY
jgi:hypothetical protein